MSAEILEKALIEEKEENKKLKEFIRSLQNEKHICQVRENLKEFDDDKLTANGHDDLFMFSLMRLSETVSQLQKDQLALTDSLHLPPSREKEAAQVVLYNSGAKFEYVLSSLTYFVFPSVFVFFDWNAFSSLKHLKALEIGGRNQRYIKITKNERNEINIIFDILFKLKNNCIETIQIIFGDLRCNNDVETFSIELSQSLSQNFPSLKYLGIQVNCRDNCCPDGPVFSINANFGSKELQLLKGSKQSFLNFADVLCEYMTKLNPRVTVYFS